MPLQSNLHFGAVPPSEVPTPSVGYYAIFIGDGTEGTTLAALYKKDSADVVTPLLYDSESAQDAIGSILTDTATVDLTYDDVGNTISAVVIGSALTGIPQSGVVNLVTALAGKQPTGNYITALTSDVTATGPGSVTATLATVNANVGSFGSASAVATQTVNAKGLTTATSTTLSFVHDTSGGNAFGVTPAVTLASGDIIRGSITYEAA